MAEAARPAAPGVVAKGKCNMCGQTVYSCDERGQMPSGEYVHTACLKKYQKINSVEASDHPQGQQAQQPPEAHHKALIHGAPHVPHCAAPAHAQAPHTTHYAVQAHAQHAPPGAPMAPPAPHSAAQAQVHHAPGGGQTQADAAKGQERARLLAFLKASQKQGGVSTPRDFQNFVKSASQPAQHFASTLVSMNPQEQHHPNQHREPQLRPPQQQPQQPYQQQRKYLTQHHPHQQQVQQLLSGQYQQTPQHAQHEQVAHIPRQPGSPPSPSVPPKGILKTIPSNPISAAGSNPVPAAGTPDYPMMGPLSDGRDGAPHAMAGQKEGSGGQNEGSGPIVKGMCAVCQKVVYNVHTRTKNATGQYVHVDCASVIPPEAGPHSRGGEPFQGHTSWLPHGVSPGPLEAKVVRINGQDIL